MGRSAIHPGEHLAEQLEELGMSAAELVRQLTYPRTELPKSSTASGLLPATRPYVLDISSTTARNSG
jgi:hypothetical protein